MNLFNRENHFQIVQGTDLSIVVGAPHHGTRPNVNADLNTGPIAFELAKNLSSRAVIVSNLRHKVDVNKYPLSLSPWFRQHAIRYQNEMFTGLPILVIEIHGHVSGKYPIEITTGYDLNQDMPGDRMFLDRLNALKQTLPRILSNKIGQAIPVGIYPLDQDVKKTATNTFTFQKIRRMRNLIGLQCYGLHIELSAEFRTSKQAKAKGYIETLATVLGDSISSAFFPLPLAGSMIPVRIDLITEEKTLLEGVEVKVNTADKNNIPENIVILHPGDLEKLKLLEGDYVSLTNHGEKLSLAAETSLTIRQGCIEVPARFRRQLGINPGDRILINKTAVRRPYLIDSNTQVVNPYFVVSRLGVQGRSTIWMNPEDMKRLKLIEGSNVAVKYSNTNIFAGKLTTIKVDLTLARCNIVISSDLAKRYTVTIGEVLLIEAANE